MKALTEQIKQRGHGRVMGCPVQVVKELLQGPPVGSFEGIRRGGARTAPMECAKDIIKRAAPSFRLDPDLQGELFRKVPARGEKHAGQADVVMG